MKILARSALLILLLFMLVPSDIVQAVPPIPQVFYGTVTLDGEVAPDGTQVTAEFNGRQVDSDNVSAGLYQITVNTQEGDPSSGTVTFYIDGLLADSANYTAGGPITENNLSVDTPIPPGPTVTLTIKTEGSGSTSPSPGNRSYEEGDSVTVRAIPSQGWNFDGWTGDVPSGDRDNTTVSINMTSDKSITAHFVDNSLPIISEVIVQNITKTSVDIMWATNEPATSQIEYSDGNGYILTPLNLLLVTEHLVSLSDLTPTTSYDFKVLSVDNSGNPTTSEGHSFTTSGLPATFNFSNWQFLLSPLGEGQKLDIEVNINNTGDLDGTRSVLLTVNGQNESTQDITLIAGANQLINFTVSRDTPGTYEVIIEDISLTFTVSAPSVIIPDDGGNDEGGLNPIILLLIGLGCLLLVVLIVVLILRMRSNRQLMTAAYELANEKRRAEVGTVAPAAIPFVEETVEEKEELSPAEEEIIDEDKVVVDKNDPYKEDLADTEKLKGNKQTTDVTEATDGKNIISDIGVGTITVTKQAVKKLKEALKAQTKNPNMGIRLVFTSSLSSETEQFEMRMDTKKNNDYVVSDKGLILLLINPKDSNALKDKIVDCEQTDQGVRFSIS